MRTATLHLFSREKSPTTSTLLHIPGNLHALVHLHGTVITLGQVTSHVTPNELARLRAYRSHRTCINGQLHVREVVFYAQ